MIPRVDVAIIGSGFAGSLLARILAKQGHKVVLIERGTHPRFAIGESSTPLAGLSLERIAIRYGLADCYYLATHGRWLGHLPELRCGLKRGFTFYRHHPGQRFADRGDDSERLVVAASPNDAVADTHWLRADVDHHLVRQAIAASVAYYDRVELTAMAISADGVQLSGTRTGTPFAIEARFVVDGSGANGFVARQLGLPSARERLQTQSALLYSHFAGVRLMRDELPSLPDGPYPDDSAAVHHLLDEGWMYSLRFDDGVTSAGFALTPEGVASLEAAEPATQAEKDSVLGRTDAPQVAADTQGDARAERLWRRLMQRYPTIGAIFSDATRLRPLAFHPVMQHRVATGAGDRWALLPNTYAFVDPLFSTGIAWSLRAVERLALAFEPRAGGDGLPDAEALARYDRLLDRETEQIDLLVCGAYEAMGDFTRFEAQAMLYFATVSFAELRERLTPRAGQAWEGFLGIDDPVLGALPRESLEHLRRLRNEDASASASAEYAQWIADAIAPRNVAGLANPERRRRYPVDLEILVERHALLGLTRDQVVAALPALRGMATEPTFG